MTYNVFGGMLSLTQSISQIVDFRKSPNGKVCNETEAAVGRDVMC